MIFTYIPSFWVDVYDNVHATLMNGIKLEGYYFELRLNMT